MNTIVLEVGVGRVCACLYIVRISRAVVLVVRHVGASLTRKFMKLVLRDLALALATIGRFVPIVPAVRALAVEALRALMLIVIRLTVLVRFLVHLTILATVRVLLSLVTRGAR